MCAPAGPAPRAMRRWSVSRSRSKASRRSFPTSPLPWRTSAWQRAVDVSPRVLLMDSPFAGLDAAVRGDLQDDLLELQRIAPKTIMFATQDIDEAIKLGDQIAVMAEGRMVQLATPQTLLSHP